MFISHVGHSSFKTLFNVLWIFSLLIGKSTLQSFGLHNRATRSCSIEWHNQPSCMIVPSFSSFFGFLHSSSHDRLFTLLICYHFWLWCYHLVQPLQERSELRRYDPYGLPGGHQVATLLHMKISQTTFEELTYLNCFASITDHWQCCWHYWAAWTIHRSLNWTFKLQIAMKK
jgi:hypothetical protein